VPYAVIRITEHDRKLCDEHGIVLIRNQFVGLLRACSGSRVLLYQSVRQPGRLSGQVGYFASAAVANIFPRPGGTTHAVFLTDTGQLFPGVGEDASRRAEAEGWFAAADVREITGDLYASLTGYVAQQLFGEIPSGEIVTPRFWTHQEHARDRGFRARVYRAYGGLCAISGVALMSMDGFCGLQAAHIVPRLSSPHERASAGILLAPTWHYLFDRGNIAIHDDYSWTAVVGDLDTQRVTSKRLRLPEAESDWPDVALLGRKRALFGWP
jgi:hypothetical protein